jgi:hypothetical protein
MSLPITGYDIDQVYMIDSSINNAGKYFLVPFCLLGAGSWFLIMIAIFRDRHHHDPNYLLVLNLGIADLIMLCIACFVGAKNAATGAYSLGLQGMNESAFLTEKL